MGRRLARAFDTLCDIDFTRAMPFTVLTVAFFALRLPWVGYGHGTDPDAWRVAMTAHYLLETGDYFPSRLPGNPLHELTMTLFIPGGWIATNIATAVASLVGVWIFTRLVRLLQVPNRGLVVIAFAFAPLLVINSIATMDYMWALTLILGSYYCTLTRRPVLAGILLGMAVGFRLQSVVMAAPLTYLLWRDVRLREVLPFWFATAGAALLAFSPVLVVYGIKFFNYYDASVGYQDVLRLLGKEALGVIGVLGVLAGHRPVRPSAHAPAPRRHRQPAGRRLARGRRRLLHHVLPPAARGRVLDPGVPVRVSPAGALLHPSRARNRRRRDPCSPASWT